MIGIQHILIYIVGFIGFGIGMVGIDAFHTGGPNAWVHNIFKADPNYPTQKTWVHQQILPLGVFFLMLGLGLLLHYMMDYMR